MPNKLVSIVISAYNEQDNVSELYKQLVMVLGGVLKLTLEFPSWRSG